MSDVPTSDKPAESPTVHPVIKTIERMKVALTDFFWDAFATLGINGITGDYVEFGSWGGNTLKRAYDAISAFQQPRHLWAFDSFKDLPKSDDPRDEHPVFSGPTLGTGSGGVEEFHETCRQNGVPREAYTVVEGYFSDTLPALGDGPPNDVALVYIDCNIYSSTVSAFEFLAPRMKHGMIIGFDDFYCFAPNQLAGERAALHEFQLAHPEWNFYRYRDFHHIGTSFIVERADLLER